MSFGVKIRSPAPKRAVAFVCRASGGGTSGSSCRRSQRPAECHSKSSMLARSSSACALANANPCGFALRGGRPREAAADVQHHRWRRVDRRAVGRGTIGDEAHRVNRLHRRAEFLVVRSHAAEGEVCRVVCSGAVITSGRRRGKPAKTSLVRRDRRVHVAERAHQACISADTPIISVVLARVTVAAVVTLHPFRASWTMPAIGGEKSTRQPASGARRASDRRRRCARTMISKRSPR